ncbi:MAG: hypothetical protein RCG15_07195 [Candidatus Rickettsia vulgarisii]
MQYQQDKYQKYFDEYNDYSTKHSLGNNYLLLGKEIFSTSCYKIFHYKENFNISNKRVFLIAPSIFNSPEILFLSKSQSFIDNLRQYGEVFLIDWLELSLSDYKLEDYANKVVEIILELEKRNIIQLDLIGHCIGGNLAIAASVILPDTIKTLTLLSTPWDFSHFSISRNIYQYFCLDKQVQDLPMIPKLHIQILFFLLFPEHFSQKIDIFFTKTSPEEKDLYFRIENWLLSGFALSKATYQQIMDDVINNNLFAKNLWKVDNITIDPSLITKPTYQIMAGGDRIVPESSILPLHRLLKKSTLFKVAGGHISYLINNNISSLFEKYNE